MRASASQRFERGAGDVKLLTDAQNVKESRMCVSYPYEGVMDPVQETKSTEHKLSDGPSG